MARRRKSYGKRSKRRSRRSGTNTVRVVVANEPAMGFRVPRDRARDMRRVGPRPR